MSTQQERDIAHSDVDLGRGLLEAMVVDLVTTIDQSRDYEMKVRVWIGFACALGGAIASDIGSKDGALVLRAAVHALESAGLPRTKPRPPSRH